MTTVVLELLIIAVLGGFLALFVYTLRQGAVSVPTKRAAIRQIIELAELEPGTKAIDIGSGDGRLVIALAEAGADAYGVEINPLLVWWSRWRIWRKGLSDRAQVRTASFWKLDLGDYTVVTVFAIPGVMPRLRDKARQEMQPGSKVISNIFLFPQWQPDKVAGTVRRYRT